MIINNHKNFCDRLSIDYQYQSINWYRLSLIVIDCHRLSTSSIVQVLPYVTYVMEGISCKWQNHSFVSNKFVLKSIKLMSNVTNNNKKLWRTVRLTSFQKPQLQYVLVFFNFVHGGVNLIYCQLWLWRWLPHGLSNRQSLTTTTVLFRTTFTWTIILNLLMKWLRGSNLSQSYLLCYLSLKPLLKFWEIIFMFNSIFWRFTPDEFW